VRPTKRKAVNGVQSDGENRKWGGFGGWGPSKKSSGRYKITGKWQFLYTSHMCVYLNEMPRHFHV